MGMVSLPTLIPSKSTIHAGKDTIPMDGFRDWKENQGPSL